MPCFSASLCVSVCALIYFCAHVYVCASMCFGVCMLELKSNRESNKKHKKKATKSKNCKTEAKRRNKQCMKWQKFGAQLCVVKKLFEKKYK